MTSINFKNFNLLLDETNVKNVNKITKITLFKIIFLEKKSQLSLKIKKRLKMNFK